MNGKALTEVLNETMGAFASLVDRSIAWDRPTLLTEPLHSNALGVLVGLTGDIRGWLVMEGAFDTFSAVASQMYGLSLSGHLLLSFAAELGSMTAGRVCMRQSKQGRTIYATPPTAIVGEKQMYGLNQAICVPANIKDIGTMQILIGFERMPGEARSPAPLRHHVV